MKHRFTRFLIPCILLMLVVLMVTAHRAGVLMGYFPSD